MDKDNLKDSKTDDGKNAHVSDSRKPSSEHLRKNTEKDKAKDIKKVGVSGNKDKSKANICESSVTPKDSESKGKCETKDISQKNTKMMTLRSKDSPRSEPNIQSERSMNLRSGGSSEGTTVGSRRSGPAIDRKEVERVKRNLSSEERHQKILKQQRARCVNVFSLKKYFNNLITLMTMPQRPIVSC